MIGGKSVVGRGKSKCKGPEVGTISVSPKNSKNSSVTGRLLGDKGLTGVAGGCGSVRRSFLGFVVEGHRNQDGRWGRHVVS